MLTRDFLLNADCKTAFGAIEESLLWSAEQRAASLAATLACRPDDGSVWIFGYGSLMWNPALEYRESCTGTLPGWHRAFCLRLTAGCKLELDDGRTVNALVFIMDPRHPLFEADTSAQVIAPLIARASGPLGTNAQYLFALDQELRKLGMHDACLDDLVGKVRHLLGENSQPGLA